MTTDNKENNNEIVEERSPPEESVDEKKRSREEDESAEPDEPAVSNTIDISKPVKRARRAYFIFADKVRPEIQAELPGQGVATVAKVIGQRWSSLTDDEKAPYQQEAAAERERVAQETEAWIAAGGVVETPSAAVSNDPTHLEFPVARLRKIIKLDPDNKGVSKEGMALICKTAELALAKLGQEAARQAAIQNRRKLLPDDIANVCRSREKFAFLKDDIQDLVRKQQEQQQPNAAVAASAMPKAKNALTGFFPVKSTSGNAEKKDES